MAYCIHCGNQIADGSRFLSLLCGKAQTPAARRRGGSAAGAHTHPGAARLYDSRRQPPGRARSPGAGQELYAEAGKMVYKTANVHWDTRMSGNSLGEKLMGALRRTVTGESLFLTYFPRRWRRRSGLRGQLSGRIQVFDLRAGRSLMAQRDAFLFAQPPVQFSVALVKRLGAGFFGGEGFILEKFTGPGAVFIHAGGDFIEFDLAAGQVIQVDTGCIVAFEETVDYDIQAGGRDQDRAVRRRGLFPGHADRSRPRGDSEHDAE
jgi:uncharacterized protein (AIM24 family)